MEQPSVLHHLHKLAPTLICQHEENWFSRWLNDTTNLKQLSILLSMELRHDEAKGLRKAGSPVITLQDVSKKQRLYIHSNCGKLQARDLGELLSCIDYQQAASLAWIANDISDELEATLRWLNSVTDERSQYYGLQAEFWQIADSAPAPVFRVRAAPPNWRHPSQLKVPPSSEMLNNDLGRQPTTRNAPSDSHSIARRRAHLNHLLTPQVTSTPASSDTTLSDASARKITQENTPRADQQQTRATESGLKPSGSKPAQAGEDKAKLIARRKRDIEELKRKLEIQKQVHARLTAKRNQRRDRQPPGTQHVQERQKAAPATPAPLDNKTTHSRTDRGTQRPNKPTSRPIPRQRTRENRKPARIAPTIATHPPPVKRSTHTPTIDSDTPIETSPDFDPINLDDAFSKLGGKPPVSEKRAEKKQFLESVFSKNKSSRFERIKSVFRREQDVWNQPNIPLQFATDSHDGEQTATSETKQRAEMLTSFWQGLNYTIKQRDATLRPTLAFPQPSISFATEHADHFLVAAINLDKKQASIKLILTGAEGMSDFLALEHMKAVVEDELETPLSWLAEDGSGESAIVIERNSIDLSTERSHQHLQNWMADKLECFCQLVSRYFVFD